MGGARAINTEAYMRLLTFEDGHEVRLGALIEEHVVDLSRVAAERHNERLPETLLGFIDGGDEALTIARRCLNGLVEDLGTSSYAWRLENVKVLAPLDPPRGNVLAIGRNFQAHAEESARARHEEVAPPTVFTKAQTSILGPFDDVPYRSSVTNELDWEAELGVVIGRATLNVRPEDALHSVFGYTVINDVSARDLQFGWGGQFFKGKSLDGSCPVGPWIVTSDEIADPQDLHLLLRINGETKQDASTKDMIHGISDLISKVSLGMTLLPGTLIATGTPAGVGMGRTPPEYLKPGDLMETEIEGIGTLRNRVVLAHGD
jgi:2-keto-4-pentenoate hydratase/2-oxohepta-3-ene-1,7-dioic acid hydratase in catechol pathway